MYFCKNCREAFEEDEARRGFEEVYGGYFESCPSCGSVNFTEASYCQACGEYCPDDADLCDVCAGIAKAVDNRIANADDDDEFVNAIESLDFEYTDKVFSLAAGEAEALEKYLLSEGLNVNFEEDTWYVPNLCSWNREKFWRVPVAA